MNIKAEYYRRMQDAFLQKYGDVICEAPKGHCMKATGFPLDVLISLQKSVQGLAPGVKCLILSETEEGAIFVTPTKLIELRNNPESPIVVLIPVNSSTSAEDSYGNATFQDLSVANLDEDVLSQLREELKSFKMIDFIIDYADKNLVCTIKDKISYLLFVALSEDKKEAIGTGIFHFGLIPDNRLAENKESLQNMLIRNDECMTILSDFSSNVADRVMELPIKKDTIQREVASALKMLSNIKSRAVLAEAFYTDFPDLYFPQWNKVLVNVIEVGKIHITNVDISGKSYIINEGDPEVIVDQNKGARIKLRITFSPKPSQYPDLKKITVALYNGDGFFKEADLITKKVTDNQRAYRDITITLGHGEYPNGTYFFHVYAKDENGTILNTRDEFRDEDIQKEWDAAREADTNLTLEDFQQSQRQLLKSDTLSFFLRNKDAEDETTEDMGKRMKICNVLMAYFRFRIEQNRKKGGELSMPVRVPVENRDNSNDSDDELHSWQYTTHLDTFQLRYDADNNYQIPLSKKLLAIQKAFLKKGEQLSYVDAVLADNYTETQMKSIAVMPMDFSEKPEQLLKLRAELFDAIRKSGPDNSGVIETFNVFEPENLKLIKAYVLEYRNWISSLMAEGVSQKEALVIQALDMVHLTAEMPDGRAAYTMLMPPIHPLRLAWLVNIFEQYEQWEQSTNEDERYRKPDVWYKKLDRLFYGDLTPDIAPLVYLDDKRDGYMQYIGELCFGWGFFANPLQHEDDTFSTGFRQLKAYISQLFNIGVQYRIESDVNQDMVYRLLKKFITQHPYTNKLIINLFNAGDAAVFADNLIRLEKENAGKAYDISYELRLFCNDKRFPQGEALKELMNPDTQVSEEAEAFSQAAENRLFPKLRFSINSIDEFIRTPKRFPAHISFLVNPFPTQASLKRSPSNQTSFFLNGVVTMPIVQVDNAHEGDEVQWQRFISTAPIQNGTAFAEDSVNLFGKFQQLIAASMTSDHELSIPSLMLNIKDANSQMLSLVHDFSDWVVTFDKNMGPEYYDMPSRDGVQPYLLDYIPSPEVNGISSFLTCRPSSEIEGIMSPHFKAFGIDVSNRDSFIDMLSDIRSVSSSMIMQLESSKNKAFEVLGTTLMKRMLMRKGLLTDSFIIPIDLHQQLFVDLDSNSSERADNLLVDFHPSKREIVFTIIEIKCRQHLSDDEREALQEKMKRQIKNTILALQTNFDPEFKNPDRLDRELKNVELQNLLLFYSRRAARYKYLNEETAKEYEDFITSLHTGDFTIRFKELGLIYEFQNTDYQHKDFVDETLFYTLGKPMIELIVNRDNSLKTTDLALNAADSEFRTYFETSDRVLREESFDAENDISGDLEEENREHSVSHQMDVVLDEPKSVITEIQDVETEQGPKVTSEPKTTVQSEESSEAQPPAPQAEIVGPAFDILVGKNSNSEQYGILGESVNGHRKIALDLMETNTISLFGVQGAGKSYTIGTVTEMTLKQIQNVNCLPGAMASVIFHYSESQDYAPEFTSMIYANDEAGQLKKLKDVYGAEPTAIEDVVMLCPVDKIEERAEEYPGIEIRPITFNSKELNVQDWQFLFKAVGNDSSYIAQLKQIMKANRRNLTLEGLKESVEASETMSKAQKELARSRITFAEEYIDDSQTLGDVLRPGRLVIVDLRDEWIDEDDALGLFVIMLNIFAAVKQYNGHRFNKFIVFDEAHKYMGNKELTSNIVTAIREMRHKGVSLMIASQDPMSLPTEIIELSSIVLMHRFNSPQWVKHVQKSITQLQGLSSSDMSSLLTGEAYLWATKATDKGVTMRPMKISTRPRVTKHGGDTIKAI